MRSGTDADEDTVWRQVLVAVGVQSGLCDTHSFDEDVELWRGRVFLELLPDRCLLVVDELVVLVSIGIAYEISL